MSTNQHPITQVQLNQHLWKAVDLLRGVIDSGEYKQYIFCLLFYKRLCDVWNEKYSEQLHIHGGNHKKALKGCNFRFVIPFSCMWNEEQREEPEFWPSYVSSDGKKIPCDRTLRSNSSHVGFRLNRVLCEIEKANPSLNSIFRHIDFSDERRFSDDLLNALLNHFELYRLRTSDVNTDILGNAYEYLIKYFADDAGQKGGEFYTPKEVVQLIVEVLQPQTGMSVYDPTCGSGGMLLECLRYVQRDNQNEVCQLYGQERNLNTWTLCTISLLLHDVDHAHIKRGDTILHPQHIGADKKLKKFDVILANPPFSLKNWGYKQWVNNGDEYSRVRFGIPPERYGDFAFITHIVQSMNENGIAGVVVPMGVLFRGGKEKIIRKNIIEIDLLDAIVGLGPNLFFGATIPAAILFFKKKKSASMKNKILFVNAEEEITNGGAQNYLSVENIRSIRAVVSDYKEKALFSRVVDRDEIRDNDHNLNIIRYVQTTPPPPEIDIKQVLLEISSVKEKLNDDYLLINTLLGEWDL